MAERVQPHQGAGQLRAGLLGRLIPLVLLLIQGGGCAGYEATTKPMLRDLSAGRQDAALGVLNKALGVKEAQEIPREFKAETPLLLLERATVLQALNQHVLSSKDYQAADKHLEVLNLDGDEIGSVIKYLYSDDATVYKAPPHEKTLLNTLNMLNYLTRGDASGARVEARRLLVMEKYLKDHEGDQPLLAMGAYLSGFAYEHSGKPAEAMRYYADARGRGGIPGLDVAIGDLHARTGVWDSRLGPEPARAPPPAAAPPAAAAPGAPGPPPPPTGAATGDLLVVVGTGRVPNLQPERVPIGAAFVYLTSPNCAQCLSPSQRASYNTFAAKGILKFLNYPKTVRVQSAVTGVSVRVDGQPALGGVAMDTESTALKAHERGKGMLMLAAFSRALTRAVAAEATSAGVNAARGGGRNDFIGLLAGLAVEGILVAQDVPDTRSWTTLPGRFHVYRARVAPGDRTVTIDLTGRAGGQITRQVNVPPGGFGVVTHWTLR